MDIAALFDYEMCDNAQSYGAVSEITAVGCSCTAYTGQNEIRTAGIFCVLCNRKVR